MRPGVSETTQNAVNCAGTERHKCIMRRAEHEVQLTPQFRCGFSFVIGGEKENGRGKPQPFHEVVLQQLYPTSRFSPALPPFKSERLEVPVFRRAGADSRSAAQASGVLGAYYETALFRQQRFLDRSEVRVVGIGFGNGPVERTTGIT